MSKTPPPKKARVARGKSDGKYLGAHGPTTSSKLSGLSIQPLRDSPSARIGCVMGGWTKRIGPGCPGYKASSSSSSSSLGC